MQFNYRVLSAAQLAASADHWNDLWLRSDVDQPTVRAEGIALWLESFSSPDRLHVLVVECEGRFVAGLPLVHRSLAGLYPMFELPVNCWANCGDLLLDPEVNTEAAILALLGGLKQESISLLMLDEINLNAARWIQFRGLLDSHGGAHVAGQHPVGVIDVLHDWQAYEASWSSKFRNSLRRTRKKLEATGDMQVQRHRNLAATEVELYMQMAFEIEHRSWKGASGTSILSTPGMSEYMLREAQTIAAAGMLEIWMLTLDDLPIAFEYCHFAKGVCFAQKIGYDPEYRQYGPGKLLRRDQLKAYHDRSNCRLLDMLGLFSDDKAKWATRTYQVGRVYAGVGSPISDLLVSTYAWTAPAWQRLRGANVDSEATPTPEAAAYLLSARKASGSKAVSRTSC